MHVQGDLVTGEATADLGGLVLAWRAMHAARCDEPAADAHRRGAAAEPRRNGFTPDQLFFIAFAHSWAGAIRPKQAEEMVTTDPHPPAEDRTNGTLANSPEFQRAFAISGPETDGQDGPLRHLVRPRYLRRFESSRSFSESRSRTGASALKPSSAGRGR